MLRCSPDFFSLAYLAFLCSINAYSSHQVLSHHIIPLSYPLLLIILLLFSSSSS